MHGYDNDEPTMRPAMLARGPDFKNSHLETFKSIEIYPMVCSLLKLKTCHGTDANNINAQGIVKGVYYKN